MTATAQKLPPFAVLNTVTGRNELTASGITKRYDSFKAAMRAAARLNDKWSTPGKYEPTRVSEGR